MNKGFKNKTNGKIWGKNPLQMIRAPFIDFGGSSDIRRHSPDV